MENGAVFQKSVWRSIFSLCVPALVSIVVMMLYNMADMYFVGWLDDYAQVAAVSLAGPVFSVLMGISTMIGNGGCTKIAQALGADDLERVRNYSALCVWGSIVSGAVFAMVCVLFCDPLLRLLGTNAEMWDDTKSYVLIMALGAPIVLLNHSLGGALRGEGEITAGLVGGMVSTVSNIVLDPIFILVLKLGVGGAAAATVLGNAIALGYYMVYKARSHGRCIIGEAEVDRQGHAVPEARPRPGRGADRVRLYPLRCVRRTGPLQDGPGQSPAGQHPELPSAGGALRPVCHSGFCESGGGTVSGGPARAVY